MPEPATPPGVTVRPAGPDDDDAIARLLDESAPGHAKSDVDVLRWQYRRPWFGPTVSVVAEVDGDLVAHYSLLAVPFAVGGVPVPAAHGADVAVHPAQRGRGLARAVAARLLQEGRSAGFEVVVSNLNDQSVGALTPLGWQLVAEPRVHLVPIDGSLLLAHARLPAALADALVTPWRGIVRRARGGSHVEVAEQLPPDLAPVAAGVAPGTGIVRDERWWAWRYGDHPHGRYRFVTVRREGQVAAIAALSWRRERELEVAQLLDHASVDDLAHRELLAAVAEVASVSGSAAVVAAALPGSAEGRRLRRAGFAPVPRPLQPRPVRLLAVDLAGTRPGLTGEEWSFRLGDQDHL